MMLAVNPGTLSKPTSKCPTFPALTALLIFENIKSSTVGYVVNNMTAKKPKIRINVILISLFLPYILLCTILFSINPFVCFFDTS